MIEESNFVGKERCYFLLYNVSYLTMIFFRGKFHLCCTLWIVKVAQIQDLGRKFECDFLRRDASRHLGWDITSFVTVQRYFSVPQVLKLHVFVHFFEGISDLPPAFRDRPRDIQLECWLNCHKTLLDECAKQERTGNPKGPSGILKKDPPTSNIKALKKLQYRTW